MVRAYHVRSSSCQRSPMLQVVLATSNAHKVDELRAIFAEMGLQGVQLVGLADLLGTKTREPEETGTTFEQNATIKAVSYAKQLGRMCLADDSGLEIDALAGKPGVISSHYCTDGREAGMSRPQRDKANNERVMREMQAVPADERFARFVCVMCLTDPEGRVLATTRGTFEGRIGMSGDVPRGEHGFGYDPLFLLPSPDRRASAELPPEEKNRLSHRGKAARAMGEQLRRFAQAGGAASHRSA